MQDFVCFAQLCMAYVFCAHLLLHVIVFGRKTHTHIHTTVHIIWGVYVICICIIAIQ